MFYWLFADVQMQSISQSLASFNASSLETILSAIISHLFPTKTIITSLLLLFFTSSIHRATFRNVYFLVRSKTTRAAAEERQYDRVMALNSSCPAVSQICNLMTLLLTRISLHANSTPTVYQWQGSNLLSTNRPTMLVLPTAISPTSINLNEQSNRAGTFID